MKEKGLNGYTAELNKLVRAEHGGELPGRLAPMIHATAQCQRMIEKIEIELDKSPLTSIDIGSMGQQKTTLNPLLAQHEKYLGRLAGLLYELGLSNRKAAAKPDTTEKTEDDPFVQLIGAMNS